MEYLDKNVKVAKEAMEVMDAAVGLVTSMKNKLDGGLSVTEVMAALMENMNKLAVAMQGAEKIAPEFKLDPGATLAAGALGGMEIVKVIMK
jgi:hypothetical protein